MNRVSKVVVGSAAAVVLFAAGALASPTVTGWTDYDQISDAHVSSVNWADMNGIVRGHADGTFRPDVPVTRQQLASMLDRYNQVAGRPISPTGGQVTSVPAGEITTAIATCPFTRPVLNASYEIEDEPADVDQAAQISVLRSQPTIVEDDGSLVEQRAWEVRVANASDTDVTVRVKVACGGY